MGRERIEAHLDDGIILSVRRTRERAWGRIDVHLMQSEGDGRRREEEEDVSSLALSMTDSLDHLDTQYSACSVEFCPQEPRIFACGTYQLVQTDQDASTSSPKTERIGRCLLYRVSDSNTMCAILFITGISTSQAHLVAEKGRDRPI
jgi:hypothetical protein